MEVIKKAVGTMPELLAGDTVLHPMAETSLVADLGVTSRTRTQLTMALSGDESQVACSASLQLQSRDADIVW